MEILLTPKSLGPPKIGGPRLKPFQPNGKSAFAVKPLGSLDFYEGKLINLR